MNVSSYHKSMIYRYKDQKLMKKKKFITRKSLILGIESTNQKLINLEDKTINMFLWFLLMLTQPMTKIKI